MTSGSGYLAAAYVVVLAAVLVYVVIISLKLSRLRREVEELADLARERGESESREEVSVG